MTIHTLTLQGNASKREVVKTPSSPTPNNRRLGFHLESPSLWREEEEHPTKPSGR
jgi:hypothetical protein